MKFKTTLYLLLAVCVMAGMIRLIDKHSSRLPTDDRLFPQARAEAITHLTIERGDSFYVDLSRKGDRWLIDRPLASRAIGEDVNTILGAIEDMRRLDTITAEQRRDRDLSLKDYGLKTARLRVRFRDKLGWSTVLIGNDSALDELVYVTRGKGGAVFATTRDLLKALPETVEQLRDHTVLPGDPGRTTRLEVTCPGVGFSQLTQSDGRWILQQPRVARADAGKVVSLLDALYKLETTKFVWDPAVRREDAPAPEADVEPEPETVASQYGLTGEEPSRIRVWLSGDTVGQELILGKPDEAGTHLYAKLRDSDGVFTVDKRILDLFAVPAAELRDKRVFAIEPRDVSFLSLQQGDHKVVLQKGVKRGWYIVEPVQWQADRQVVTETLTRIMALRTEAFLDGTKANLKVLGLEPPAYAITVRETPLPASASPAGSAASHSATDLEALVNPPCVRIGFVPEEEDRLAFAMYEGDDILLRIRPSLIRALGPALTEPIAYRDRTMLTLYPDHINRISLKKEGREQTVVRGEDGVWSAAAPAGGLVQADVIDDMLFFMGHLRSLRIETQSPENLGAYGLDRTLVTLTVGLSGGDAGIQKTVILGFRAGTDGIYAMVQGQDVVFVLDKKLAAKMTRDLTAVSPKGAGAEGPGK